MHNLFLDDLRSIDMVYPNTTHNFVIVRSYDAFVAHIQEFDLPKFISFDNDFGEDENTNLLPDGYACTKWLVYESGLNLTSLKFQVHSANPVAWVQIESLLNDYLRFLRG